VITFQGRACSEQQGSSGGSRLISAKVNKVMSDVSEYQSLKSRDAVAGRALIKLLIINIIYHFRCVFKHPDLTSDVLRHAGRMKNPPLFRLNMNFLHVR